jgi:hypothetical protein
MKDVGALDRKKAARSRIKAIRKLSKRRKKGRLPTHVNEQIKSIKNQRDAKRNQELQMVLFIFIFKSYLLKHLRYMMIGFSTGKPKRRMRMFLIMKQIIQYHHQILILKVLMVSI